MKHKLPKFIYINFIFFIFQVGKDVDAIKVLKKVHDENFSHRNTKEYKVFNLLVEPCSHSDTNH